MIVRKSLLNCQQSAERYHNNGLLAKKMDEIRSVCKLNEPIVTVASNNMGWNSS